MPQFITGPNYPTTTVDQADGSFSYFNPSGVQQVGGLAASGALTGNLQVMDTLHNTGFGFNLPVGAVINGIVVEVSRQASQNSGSRFIVDDVVSLLKAGTPTGSNKADTVTKWLSDTFHTITYGSPSDLWGASWTQADINNGNFGLDFQAQGSDPSATTSATIDFIRITVYYTVTPPTLTTTSITGIGQNSATVNGNISSDGGSALTGRGVQIGTTPNPDRSVDETGAVGTGNFSEGIANLSPGQTYYARSYATNAGGTSYGAWLSFTTLPATYSITIGGINRTADVLNQTIQVDDVANDRQSQCTFSIVDRSGNGLPTNEQEVIITLPDGTRLFGGIIIDVDRLTRQKYGVVGATVQCVDYVRIFDSNLVSKSYTGMTDAAIIMDIVDTYCPGLGITTNNVIAGVTIDQISFNYLQPSVCMKKITDLTGRNWYIDYNKDIHYFPLTQSHAPFDIDDVTTTNKWWQLHLKSNSSQLKNRVYVRGGTKLSDPTTYSTKGDGSVRKFVLPDKPHNITMTVNGVTKSIGIKNIDTSGFDFYLNYDEKYLEQDAAGTTLTTSDVLSITYQYDIPILVAVESATSIAQYGVKEFAIFDTTISTTQAARDRASAELTDYANSLIEGDFITQVNGFRSGQYVNINSAAYGVNANYIVQKVTAKSLGAGLYQYQVYLASAKTMGIIRFLIEMLELSNNNVAIATNEVVDNLLTVNDSLLSDSLMDALTPDSAGPYSTWASDSLTTTPGTAKWDLFQWR